LVVCYVLVAQWIERLPPKQQVARSIRAEDDSNFIKKHIKANTKAHPAKLYKHTANFIGRSLNVPVPVPVPEKPRETLHGEAFDVQPHATPI
jgi:hypothetical protein